MLAVASPVSALPVAFTPRADIVNQDGSPTFAWEITCDEYLRLSKLFNRDFGETKVIRTYVTAPPKPCVSCGKWTEFIDWVYTALQRTVHSPDFMFNALRDGTIPKGKKHDVYCSNCGTLTHIRTANKIEGEFPGFNQAATASDEHADEFLWIPSQPWFCYASEAEEAILAKYRRVKYLLESSSEVSDADGNPGL
ncbi:hypothetical protein NLI96_g8215 [Meripilus lineatus]|uniref:Uncharacterized protein n=1 Tax=Meripilus lineatus TaxID=2056292 RepID=A0AAD5UXN8_9APHY|nr:hypothetical protein NLI96_g8215 [Physisporinus lineatus]